MTGALKPLWTALQAGPRQSWRELILVFVASSLGELALVSLSNSALSQPEASGAAVPFVAAVLLWFLSERSLQRRAAVRLNGAALAELRLLLGVVRRAPLRVVEAVGEGALRRAMGQQLAAVASAGPDISQLTRSAARLLVGLPYAVSLSVQGAGLAATMLGLIGVGAWYQSRSLMAGFGRAFGAEFALREQLRLRVGGHAALLQHAGRDAALRAEHEALAGQLVAGRSALFGQFYSDGHLLNALFYAILGALAFVLPFFEVAERGELQSLSLVVIWASTGVYGVVFALPRATEAASALAQIQELRRSLESQGLEPLASTQPRPPGALDALRLEGVRFQYPDSPGRPGFSLGPVDLTLHPGELVLVTGANGSGKSTFVKVLCGLYTPDAGRVVVNGQEVGPQGWPDFRALFGLIPASVHIFEQVYGFRPEQAEAAAALLERLDIAHKTQIVDGRITTRDLSTGQRQRLAMVLTLLADRPVLIFDEWAASQDPEYRELFYKELLPELKARGKLVVVVSHDDRYFGLADRRLEFDAGRARWIGGEAP